MESFIANIFRNVLFSSVFQSLRGSSHVRTIAEAIVLVYNVASLESEKKYLFEKKVKFSSL